MKKKQLFILLACLIVLILGLLFLIYTTSQPNFYKQDSTITKENKEFLKDININPDTNPVVVLSTTGVNSSQSLIKLSGDEMKDRIVIMNNTPSEQNIFIDSPSDSLPKRLVMQPNSSMAIPAVWAGNYTLTVTQLGKAVHITAKE